MGNPVPLVLLVHRDPVVHDLIGGTLGDEFSFLAVRTPEQALKRAARQAPAVVVVDCEEDDIAPETLIAELRGRDPHVRAIFLADSKATGRAWKLADLGMVLPKRQDLERLRHAIRNAARLQAMSAGVERLRADTGVPERPASRTAQTRRDRVRTDGRYGDVDEPPVSNRELPPREGRR